MTALEFHLTDTPDSSVKDLLLQGILSFNESFLGPSNSRPLAILLREPNAGMTVGGLSGKTAREWLMVELIFVPDLMRSQGLGTELLRRAESEARSRACRGSYLNTFSPRICRFYENQGYTIFGVIDDHPKGHQLYFLQKAL